MCCDIQKLPLSICSLDLEHFWNLGWKPAFPVTEGSCGLCCCGMACIRSKSAVHFLQQGAAATAACELGSTWQLAAAAQQPRDCKGWHSWVLKAELWLLSIRPWLKQDMCHVMWSPFLALRVQEQLLGPPYWQNSLGDCVNVYGHFCIASFSQQNAMPLKGQLCFVWCLTLLQVLCKDQVCDKHVWINNCIHE